MNTYKIKKKMTIIFYILDMLSSDLHCVCVCVCVRALFNDAVNY
jgi:hypothetical protein